MRGSKNAVRRSCRHPVPSWRFVCATTGSKWLSCGKVWNMIAGTQDSLVEPSTSGVCARVDHTFLRSPMAFHPPALLPYTTMQIDEVPLRSLMMHFPFVLPRLQQTQSLCKANNNKPSHSNLIPFLSCPVLSYLGKPFHTHLFLLVKLG